MSKAVRAFVNPQGFKNFAKSIFTVYRRQGASRCRVKPMPGARDEEGSLTIWDILF